MKFERLLEIIGTEPVFETGLLLAGAANRVDIRRQLSRWKKSGRIHQLRRGLYALAPPYRKVVPHPFLIANRLVRGSYVSCESALSFDGLIPEYGPNVISVTSSRPYRWWTPSGYYEFHHIKPNLLRGYQKIEVGNDQKAFIATPEKALLDLAYLKPESDAPEYLQELRLQDLNRLDLNELKRLALMSKSLKLLRVVKEVARLQQQEEKEFEIL